MCPEKAGWLQCQGHVVKSWRKRWFVLKDGYLFRFRGNGVTHASKPRGIIDLSKVCMTWIQGPATFAQISDHDLKSL